MRAFGSGDWAWTGTRPNQDSGVALCPGRAADGTLFAFQSYGGLASRLLDMQTQ